MNKILSSVVLTLATISSTVHANPAQFEVGLFTMYDQPHYEETNMCDVGSTLILDKAQLSGKIAVLSNFVNGMCELYVPSNERIYVLSSSTPDGCGSLSYTGQHQGPDGVTKLTIIDHRFRRCRDLVPAQIILTEQSDTLETVLYSHDEAPVGRCTAEVGVMKNPESGKCKSFINGCQRADLIAAGFTESTSLAACQIPQ